MDGSVLQCVSEEKDLGVTVSDDLKWEKQCREAVKKANRILGTIKRNFTDRTQSTLIPLYKSLVRPHLEYCCSVWNPHFRKDIELIEGVQRRATELVKDVEHIHYNDRFEHLGLMCFHTRKIRSDLIDTYKIINGIYNVKTELLFDYDQSGRRGHSKKLFLKRSRLVIMQKICIY